MAKATVKGNPKAAVNAKTKSSKRASSISSVKKEIKLAKKLEAKPWCYILVSPNAKVKVDKEDVERINQHKWRITYGTTGRMRVVTTVRTANGSRHLTLGRFLMKPPKNKQVYPQRFADGLDYRKSNLLICSMKERQRVLPKNRMNATSEWRGVSYSQRNKKWKAAIKINGKSITIGFYDSEIEAARQYNRVAREKFGEIAYQNPVGGHKKPRKD